MTYADRIAIVTAATDYALANFTFEVGPAVRCDQCDDGIRVVVCDGCHVWAAVLVDEHFHSADEALAHFAQRPAVQLSMFS